MDNQEQRDYAEESANRALLREGDVGPYGPINRAAILRGRAVDSLLDSGATAEPIAIDCGRTVNEIQHAAHVWDSAGTVVTLGRYHCQGYGAPLDDAAPAGDGVWLDWTLAGSDPELADGMAWLAETNLGAPWAVVAGAIERVARRGQVSVGALQTEILLTIRKARYEGLRNA